MPDCNVISIRADVTKNGNTFYRCHTAEGIQFNVFQSSTLARDTFLVLYNAGYGAELLAMKPGQVIGWREWPIAVTVVEDGQFFKLASAGKRPLDAMPDSTPQAPDRALQALKAQKVARHTLNWPFVVLDTETTGTGHDDQIISIAALSHIGERRHYLVRPTSLSLLSDAAIAVHGITRERLAQEHTLAELEPELRFFLEDRGPFMAVGYNVGFDIRMIERACQIARIEPFACAWTLDVMALYAEYRGCWSDEFQRWEVVTLSDAAKSFGLSAEGAHDALVDVEMTYDILEAIARGQQIQEARS